MSHRGHRAAPHGTCGKAAGDSSERSHEAARRAKDQQTTHEQLMLKNPACKDELDSTFEEYSTPALLLCTAVVLWLSVVVVFVLFPSVANSADGTPLAALHVRKCIPEKQGLAAAIEEFRLGTFVCHHNPATALLEMTVGYYAEREGSWVSVVETLTQRAPGSFNGVDLNSLRLLTTRWRTLVNYTGAWGATHAHLIFTSVTMDEQLKMNYVVVPVVGWKFAAAAMWCICALMCIGTLGEICIAFDTILLCRDGRGQVFETLISTVWQSVAKALLAVYAVMMSVSVAADSGSIATAISDERIDGAVAYRFRAVKAQSSMLCFVLLASNAKFLVYTPRIRALKCATVLWLSAYVYFVVAC